MIKSEFVESVIKNITMDTFKNRFKKQISGALQKELGIKNVMAIPALSK